MIVIAGTIDLDADRRDECIAASIALQRSTREDEPGCMAYCFAPDPLLPGRIQVYELWADGAALAAHFTHRNYLGMRDMFAEFGPITADNRKYRVDASEPVYDADHRPRADFFTVAGPS